MKVKVARVFSSAQIGIDAPLVTVEADVSSGLPQVRIVGMPETAVRESKDRVRAAVKASGFEFPTARVTVNLAPADLPKSSGRYDLAIAIAILRADGQIKHCDTERFCLLGELGLTGELRHIQGVLPAALQITNSAKYMIVPTANDAEAALAENKHIRIAATLKEVIGHLTGVELLSRPVRSTHQMLTPKHPRLSDVKGQLQAKRALTIAAAGCHNLLMIGPPGTGKTMLASRLNGLIPPMDLDESLEVASIASVSRQAFNIDTWRLRPFRTPHHTTSAVAMVGGSTPPKPGEISLAHHGVLFLDELPEYPRHVLEVLREPLESGEIWISRASHQVRFPADFQLVSAMNPCPCGYYGDERHECNCSPEVIARYRSRLSGPLVDRIDIHVEVPPLPSGTLRQSTPSGEDDSQLRQIVCRVRQIAIDRQGVPNAKLDGKGVEQHCHLKDADQAYLENAVTRLGISTRGYIKVLKLARTIADLSERSAIKTNDLVEALSYRRLDRPK